MLKEELWKELKKIPSGGITTYKELALKLGTGPRVIAKIISQNPHPIEVPCHRVICSDGRVGGYTYKGKLNPEMKIKLLKKEGVRIVNGKVVL